MNFYFKKTRKESIMTEHDKVILKITIFVTFVEKKLKIMKLEITVI